jgi:hypothetical protein
MLVIIGKRRRNIVEFSKKRKANKKFIVKIEILRIVPIVVWG